MTNSSQDRAVRVRELVLAAHGRMETVRQVLEKSPELLDAAHEWAVNDLETPIQAAAHVGNREIAEYLLNLGAPLRVCTAAMLGRADEVKRQLEQDPGKIEAAGAHGIPLLAHAALSGNADLVQALLDRGAKRGMTAALHNAVAKGAYEVARTLLATGPVDIQAVNFQGKTLLAVAGEMKDSRMVTLLRSHGAVEAPDPEGNREPS